MWTERTSWVLAALLAVMNFGVHVVLGENTDHVDTVRADGRTRLMKMIIFLVALAFAVSAGVATVMSIYLHQSEACQGNNC